LVTLVVMAACGSSGNVGTSDAGGAPDVAMPETGLLDSGGAPDAALDVSTVSDAPADGPPLDGGLGTLPLSSGGSGAVAVVSAGGKQKMYVPANHSAPNGDAVIAVVDIGVAGNGVAGVPALAASIDLGSALAATTIGGDATMVVAAASGTRDLWFIDPVTDTVVDHRALDATFGQSSFSLSGGYVAGVMVDSSRNTAILAVWEGFALVDLQTHDVTTILQAPPSENFGFDRVHGLVYAPFYDCKYATNPDGTTPAVCQTPTAPGDALTLMTDGLSVLRLSDGAVFTYEDPSAMDPVAPLGGEPDSASVDPTTQLVVVPSEAGHYQNVIDFSQATFDTASHTVTAPHSIVQNLDYQGVAIDPSSHLALLETEAQAGIAVLRPAGASTGSSAWVAATMPNLPGGMPYGNIGDPHGIAATASIVLGGKPVGLLVESTWTWAARIDLSALANLGQPDAGVTATSAQVQAAVTYLNMTTM
jgi:hypothetical protein